MQIEQVLRTFVSVERLNPFLPRCVMLLFGLCLLGCWAAPQECRADLKTRLDATLESPALRGAKLGVLVVRRSDGQVLYERNPDVSLIP
ncbi:MAG: hypothetical protein JRC77_05920, partial [Deltaproteobacteria bacterium]|nr:hypothetical protein [Deltaproteobacteria bacterium]